MKEVPNQRIFDTRTKNNYSLFIKSQRLQGILVEKPERSVFYFFEPEGDVPKVNDEILEAALKALLRVEPAAFDIVTACFYGMKEESKYLLMADKIFKDYWNELYNLAIADSIFGRKVSLSEDFLQERFDFFAKEGQDQNPL